MTDGFDPRIDAALRALSGAGPTDPADLLPGGPGELAAEPWRGLVALRLSDLRDELEAARAGAPGRDPAAIEEEIARLRARLGETP